METEIMNHRQKLGYTALGALIMLIGLAIGSIVAPPLTAQSDGVFDEILCRKLTVVDSDSIAAVNITSTDGVNAITIYDPIRKNHNMRLSTDLRGAHIDLHDHSAITAVGLMSHRSGGKGVFIRDGGKAALSMGFVSEELGSSITIHDRDGNTAVGMHYSRQQGSSVVVTDEHSQLAVHLGGSDREINIVDRIGTILWTAP